VALPVGHLGHDHGAAHSQKMSGEAHYHMENNECESPSKLKDNKVSPHVSEDEHQHEAKPTKTLSKTTVFILMLAFGIHEIFEGIAFGLMESTTVAVQLAIGIVIHKTCASVSLGAGFAEAGFSTLKITLMICGFSLSTPLGIIIGMNLKSMTLVVTSIFF
jgi:zinc transporter 1/2/3